ncbi:hypothetical protein XM38_043750 [Halomicronema hongdechloris C2206]|uniref:Uncharacterized protein n=1 Tax=Halomicronema hongdechloris C2206 TaxID=1641165 RepID=A0A1Z3HSX8_9CYAN|nr:hypothetical protein [Halomicronema hongdechloris]ASC73408.1 hypothetical protein XM38_043750 [Halomicronema hongdechloris C2206]
MTAEEPRHSESDAAEEEAAASVPEPLTLREASSANNSQNSQANGDRSVAEASHRQRWQRGLEWASGGWQTLCQSLQTGLPRGVRRWLPMLVRSRLWLGSLVVLGILVVMVSSFNTSNTSSEQVAKRDAPSTQAKPASTPEKPEAMAMMPDPQLIADIQAQVADITATYAEDLIQSVQAEFANGVLTIHISDDWYTLMRSQQTRLSQDLLQRAQELSFSKLYLRDPQGNLVARSPVIGSNMVILQRDSPPIDEPTASYLFRIKVGDDTEISWPQ